MPNVRITHIQADDWTDVLLPIPCSGFVLENADPVLGFSYRSHAEFFDSQRDIAAGFGVEINSGSGRSFRADEAAGQVKGGQIVVSIGMSLAQRLAVPQSA
jgi:hypothetical protein